MKLQQRFIHAAASRLEGSAEVVRTLLASPKEVPRQRRPRLPRRTMAGCKAFDPIPASPPCRPDRPAFAPPPPPRPRAIPGRPRFCTNELVAARANPRGRAGVRCRRSLGAGRPGPCEPDAAVLHERLAGAQEARSGAGGVGLDSDRTERHAGAGTGAGAAAGRRPG